MGATDHLLVFRLDDRPYGLSLDQVDRVVRSVEPTPLPQASNTVLGAIDFHGAVVPLLDARARAGSPHRAIGLEDLFVIVRLKGRVAALRVDDVAGVVRRPPEDLVAADRIVPGLPHLAGVVPTDDGLMLVHDLDRFLSADEEQSLDEAIPA